MSPRDGFNCKVSKSQSLQSREYPHWKIGIRTSQMVRPSETGCGSKNVCNAENRLDKMMLEWGFAVCPGGWETGVYYQ